MLWKKLRSKTEAQALPHTAFHTDSLCLGTGSAKLCLIPNTSQQSSIHLWAASLALPRGSSFPIRPSGAAINTDKWDQRFAFISGINAWFPCWLFVNTEQTIVFSLFEPNQDSTGKTFWKLLSWHLIISPECGQISPRFHDAYMSVKQCGSLLYVYVGRCTHMSSYRSSTGGCRLEEDARCPVLSPHLISLTKSSPELGCLRPLQLWSYRHQCGQVCLYVGVPGVWGGRSSSLCFK